jgi:hypothetical protein
MVGVSVGRHDMPDVAWRLAKVAHCTKNLLRAARQPGVDQDRTVPPFNKKHMDGTNRDLMKSIRDLRYFHDRLSAAHAMIASTESVSGHRDGPKTRSDARLNSVG